MKILIWALSIFVTSIVAAMIKSAGITLGAIPTILLYAPLFFITPKLCQKWDDHKKSKESLNKTNITVPAVNSPAGTSSPKTISPSARSKDFPQAITVTDIYDLKNHFGKFVKLAIDGLENLDTFRLRTADLPHLIPEEITKSILAKPLKELRYPILRGAFVVEIEPISSITAKSYEDNHYIFGILRKKENGHFLLTNAYITSLDTNLQIVERELNAQETFEYTILDDGTLSVFDFVSSSVENVEIPERINGKTVSAISRDAFPENQTIQSLTISKTVKRIDCCAFTRCNKLETVFLGDGVETLDTAFDVCEELKKVHIGKALSNVVDSFHNCHKLVAFDIDPENEHLCVIDGVLFSKDKTVLVFCPCGRTGKYIVPYGTKIIGESAFENTDLEEVVLPDTVEEIEYNAFAWAGNIKRLVIPSSVKDIAYDAITGGFGDFEGEIVIERGSCAQQYFQDCYDTDSYKLVVLDKIPTEASVPTAKEKTETLFCRYCGTQLPLDSHFCFKCGTKVEDNVI